MVDPIEITDPMIETISQQLPDVTTEHVAMVLEAMNAVAAGDPVGTVRVDPATGNIAVRVSDQGIHKWRCTSPDGGTWDDMSPTLQSWNALG